MNIASTVPFPGINPNYILSKLSRVHICLYSTLSTIFMACSSNFTPLYDPQLITSLFLLTIGTITLSRSHRHNHSDTNKSSSLPFPSSCRQHISTSFFLNCSHTSVHLPKNFQLPNLTSKFCNPEIFCNPYPIKSCKGLGANF